jgi:hypothetical protein
MESKDERDIKIMKVEEDGSVEPRNISGNASTPQSSRRVTHLTKPNSETTLLPENRSLQR